MPQSTQTTVLLLGATGRIGGLILNQLLERGVAVRAIVRTASKLPATATSSPLLTLTTASLLELSPEQWVEHVKGCDAVVCCLGHVLSFSGLFGPPYCLVRDATRLACEAIIKSAPSRPVKFVAVSTGGASNPDGSDNVNRGWAERLFIASLSSILPPWRDSILAVQYMSTLGKDNPHLEWCAVRPEWFKDGPQKPYVTAAVARCLFQESGITMANIAHFFAELITQPAVWEQWKYKMPVMRDEVSNPLQMGTEKKDK